MELTSTSPPSRRLILLAALAFTLAVSGTAPAVDAYLTATSQIRSASNNPPFGAGLTQNAAAVNLTWYAPLDMAFGADREGTHGKLAGGTLNGIAFHDILLGNGADAATGVSVANAMAGVTMDYTLTSGMNRNFPAATYTGTDAAVLYNISATNVCRDSHSVVTFHGLTPNNNVYVQLIGGNFWSTPVAVSLNGATPVNWTSQTSCKDPGVPGVQNGTNNSALLGLTSTTDGTGSLTIDVYSTGGNGFHGLGAITVAQQLVVITGPPAAPTGLAATPVAPGSIRLNWNPAVGAASYKVSIKNTSTLEEQIVTTTTTPYTVTGLTNGTLYNFKVLGTNSFGDGNYSGVVSATPQASASCDILTCDFGTLGAATLTGTSILITVPPGQSRASLAPTITVSPYATLSPVSGTARDFTNSVTTPVPYTVTAQNGTTKIYYVTVQTYESWAHAGSLFILTTPDGANLPAGATETNFPLLVRLNSGNFTFSQAQSDGRDIRFTTAAGAALSYQIEEWDAINGSASIWVLIPTITGNARQEIKMYWGMSGVASASNPAAVFNAASGYACVMHLGDPVNPVKDDAGNLTPTNSGTTTAPGLIGKANRFADGQGINCGTQTSIYPSGSNPHSSSFWFKTASAGQLLLWWGVDQPQGKVLVRFDAPPHISVQTWSDGGGVNGASTIPLSQWTHVVHTYQNGEAKVYVNGVLDGTTTGGGPMNIPTTAGMWLGGYPYFGYHYVGDMDEVRISKVTRSANWVKLEYQNQNPLQTLVGSLVPDGTAFAVTPATVTMNEGATTTLTAQACGAQKVYWIRKQGGVNTVLAVDQLTLDYPAGRVAGNQSLVIQFKAVYPTETKTVDIPVTVNEVQPDPVFTLTAPPNWDGRQTITVTPDISNLATCQTAGVATFNYNWSATGVAVLKQITPGVLTLTRAQGSGPLTVTLVLDNGGVPVTQSKTITIQEPATDAWVQRTPGAAEKPVTSQFIPRDGTTGKGTIYYNGTQTGATSVFLRVYKTEPGSDVLYSSQTSSGSAYAFATPIDAGLFKYKVVLSSSTGGAETVRETVADLVCGDAYIIDGQSNAVAYDYYAQAATYPDLGYYSSTWIRTYGESGESGSPLNGGWGIAKLTVQPCIGVWGMALARTLMETYGIPICILNGAVGGTRIDQHQANPADHYAAGSRYSIYANLITRVAAAKLTHGIRGALWHQGEADLSNWGGNLDWDYTYYQQNFLDMSAAWKQDMPNLRYYYLFQIFATGCGASGTFTSDMLRDVQRKLPLLYSGNMSVMPTLAFPSGASCHFNIPDYEKMGLSMAPLAARDNDGLVPAAALNGPNVQRAWFTTTAHNEIALEFDQDMQWNAFSTVNFFLDRVGGKVTSGSATGKIVKLQLNGTSTNTTIDYVVDQFWDANPANLLYGTNGIAALSFYAVNLSLPSPTGLSASPNNNQVVLSWSAPTGATGYKVKRALASGGPYSVIGTPSGTSYTDTTGSNGTTYYYVVSATNGTDESADSAVASATINIIGTGVTTTTLARHSGTGSSSTYGDALAFDVTVSGSSTPTGTVILKDGGAGGTTIGSATLAGGACTISPALTALTPGSHNNLVAVYAGDSNFGSSTSGTLGTQTVSTKALTVTGTAVTPKTYDGTQTATLTGATLSGVVGGDPVTLGNATSGTFNTKDMGTGKSVSTVMTLSGASAGNYTLTQPALTGEITAMPLAITGVTANNRIYDGTTTAVLTVGALSGGVISGETVTVTAGTGSFASVNAGTWAVTASGYTLGGANAGNYVLSAQPVVPNATITARPVILAGTRVYDGTTAVAAGILAVSNKVSGDDLGLTGSVTLAAKDVGSQGLASIAPPAMVQNKTGSLTGGGSATSFNVTALTAAPTAGNTLVAVIATCNTSQNSVAGIGATSGTVLNWQRAAQSTAVANGTTTEVWYAPVLAGAGSTVTINLAGTGYAAGAVVAEYRGVLTANPVDQVAGASGTSSTNPASTGTTAATTQVNDLAFGGIGLVFNTSGTFSGISGGSQITSVTSGSATSRVRLYAIATTVATPATASFTGTMNTAQNWSGAITTFKAPSISGLSLTGAAAGNYTLAGATGAVTVTPKTLTVTGLTVSGKTYDGTTLVAITDASTLTSAEAAGAGTTADGKPYSSDALTLGGNASGAFADKHVGFLKPVTVSGKTLNGAQAGNYTLTQPVPLTAIITPRALTVAAVMASKTYDSTTTAAGTPTLTPALAFGDSASILAQTFQDPNAGTGNKVIVPNITLSDGNGGTNYAVTLTNYNSGTISPAPVTITLGGLAQTYDGTPKYATATTNPPGKPVGFTYNGSATAPTAAGIYAVAASITDPNYTGTASGTLVISGVAPMDTWRTSHFTANEITAGLAADHADLDGDGLDNLTEYILGTDPRAFTPQALSVTPAANNQFTLTFTARRATGSGYAGLTRKYDLQQSADLGDPNSWQPVPGQTHIVGADQTVTAILPDGGSNKFYRLNVRVE